MRSKLATIAFQAVPLLLLALAPTRNVLGQQSTSAKGNPKPFVIEASHYDVSLPLRDMAASAPALFPRLGIIPLRPTGPLPASSAPAKNDQVLQGTVLPPVGTINGINIDGVTGDPSGVAPPDTQGAAGDSITNQYVTIVNEVYAVYNKNTGAQILAPTSIDAIWSGFSGACSTGNGGDVDVLFDTAASRWVVSQLGPGFTSYCIAVSTTDDATGSYARYEFDFGSNIPDYPKLGVWPDAYYWTSNTFQGGSTFIGAMPCAYNRASMLSGGPANAICFQENAGVASLLPAHLDGNTPPPAGEPNPYLELLDSSDLGLFKFHVDFANPSNSTFTGPTSIAVASYSEACGGGTCIPQAGTTQQLDSLADRLMYRNAYRNLNGTEYLVVNHSVTAGSSVGVRWYQITNPNGTPSVAQQGTFAPDSSYRWMGSIAMDQQGDIALGYSASSSSIHPAVRYTGRVPSDPAGTMESEASIIEGPGSQTGGLSRWGDYSSMSIDPGDDCTFFFTTEYLPNNGSFNWNTRIGSFKFIGCGSTAPDFYLTSNPSSQTVVQGNTASYTETVNPVHGYGNTVTLSVSSGCPTGATCAVSPSSVGPPYNPSTLTVTTSSSTPSGSYTITIQGTDGTITHTTSVALTVIVPDFSISASTNNQTIKAGTTAFYPLTLTPLNTFKGNVSLTVTGLPANSTGTFSPNPVVLTYPNAANSTLAVATRKRKTPAGSYTLTITGTSGGLTHSVKVILGVTTH